MCIPKVVHEECPALVVFLGKTIFNRDNRYVIFNNGLFKYCINIFLVQYDFSISKSPRKIFTHGLFLTRDFSELLFQFGHGPI